MQDTTNKRFSYRWQVPYKVTLGDTYARFFQGLKQKKILGNVCPKCNGLHVPARPFCDKCLVAPTKWVETDGLAELISFSVTYVKFMGLPDPPTVTAIIKVGDSVTNFLHRVAGIPYDDPVELDQKCKIGMKLKPVWAENRVGDIEDIAYFAPLVE